MDAVLLDLLKRKQPRSILILGASDTGKTTLIEQLLTQWNAGEPIAVVDCDVGQSHLGPPTAIGLGLVEPPAQARGTTEKPRGSFPADAGGGTPHRPALCGTGAWVNPPFSGWAHVAVRGIAFTGAVSPEGNLETFLQATSHMIQAARQAAPRLIVDTTGLVDGELGITLKRRKVELISPELILAIQRGQELEELLGALDPVAIERLTASPSCARRSLTERAAYRDKQFARYFVNSVKQALPLNHVKLTGLGPDWPSGRVALSPAVLMDRIVCLQNVDNIDLALGLLRDVDQDTGTVTVLTPLRDVSAVTTIVMGSVRWPAQAEDSGRTG